MMAAADNPYFIQPASPLAALMTGVQGYDAGAKRTKEAEITAGRAKAMQALQSGGDLKDVLAELIGIGDDKGAQAFGTFAHHQQQAAHQAAALAETRRYHSGSLGIQNQQLQASLEGSKVPPGFQRGEGGAIAPVPGGPADPSYIATVAEKRAVHDSGRTPAGFQKGEGGALTHIPGGPADPGYIKQANDAKIGSGLLDPETIDQMAQQYRAGDTSVLTNLGRGAQGAENIKALRQEIVRQNNASGVTGADQANRNAEFFGVKAGQRTLGTKQANIELAATEFQQVLPVVQKASEAVSRTNYPDLNKIIQAYEQKTGDPKIVAFGGGVNTLVNLYSRAISPSGIPTVHDKEHAREILQKAWSQGQFNAAVGMMKAEIDAALQSPEKVRDDMRKRFLGGQGGATTHAPAPTAAPDPLGIR